MHIFFKSILTVALSIGLTNSALARKAHKLKLHGLLQKDAPKKLSIEELESQITKRAKVENFIEAKKGDVLEGVSIEDFAKAYASPDATFVTMTATNNYSQTLELKKLYLYNGVIAYKLNGELIPRTDKGTFRVVFDMSKIPEPLHRWYDSAGVWSVIDVTFK